MSYKHLSLLDDSLAAFAAAYAALEREKAKSPDQRSLQELVPAIRNAHLGLEKLLKHSLVAVNPHLIIAKPTETMLRSLSRDMRASGSPSLIASRVPFYSLALREARDAALDVGLLTLDSLKLSFLNSTIESLVSLRDRAQHAEVWATPEDLMEPLDQLFLQLRDLGGNLVGDFDRRLDQVRPNFSTELEALGAGLDAGWLDLKKVVGNDSAIEVPISMATTVMPGGNDFEIAIYGGPESGSLQSSLMLLARSPAVAATGFLAAMYSEDQLRQRGELMDAGLLVNNVSSADIPPGPPDLQSLGSLLYPTPAAAVGGGLRDLKEALWVIGERRRLARDQFGVQVLEDGGISASSAVAWAHLRSASTPPRMFTAQLSVESLSVTYASGNRRGNLTATLRPNPQLQGAASEAPLTLTGPVWMTFEALRTTDALGVGTPVGSLARYHRGHLVIRN